MNLSICVATMEKPKMRSYPGQIDSFAELMKNQRDGHIYTWQNYPDDNRGVVGSYQKLYEKSSGDILCYLHDDVICREDGWDERVRKEFEDSTVGIVGFGGARWHGVPTLYKTPYRLNDLRRGGYLSNVDDAETHGDRFDGACAVSVLDGFALCCRRSFLDRIGGWSILGRSNIDFLCYDYSICALARRFGYRIRVVGVRCHHLGGGTSVGMNIDRQEEYERSHRWFYDEFKDVMPASV